MIKRLISTLLAVFFMPFCGAALAASCTGLGNDACLATVGCVWDVDDACKSSCEVLFSYGRNVKFYVDMNACQISDDWRDNNKLMHSCDTNDYFSDGVSCVEPDVNVQEFEFASKRLTFSYTTADDMFTVLWADRDGAEQTATSDKTSSMYIFKPHEDKNGSLGISNYKIKYRFQGVEREALFCEDIESSQYYQNLGRTDKETIGWVYPDACIMPGFALDDNDNGETIFDGLVCDLALSALDEDTFCNGSLLGEDGFGEDGCGWWEIPADHTYWVGLYAEATWQPTSEDLTCIIDDSDAKFIMSADVPANRAFSFTINAPGEYVVDWGDGTVNRYLIKPDDSSWQIRHAYTTAGNYEIKMSGQQTGARLSTAGGTSPVIDFSGNTYIYEMMGDLSSIFNITSPYMFSGTFANCTSLQSIPSTLFSDVTGAARSMFLNTFQDCTSLQSIPVDLFANVKGNPGTFAFANLFNGAENITNFVDADGNEISTYVYVPEQFFGGMGVANANAFTSAFEGTDLAEVCPDGYVNANPYYADAIAPKVVCKFNPEFTITTINMAAKTTFSFSISAAGNFIVDWGDGNVQKIGKDTTATTYTHTYTKGGVYKIDIAGSATSYASNAAAISFNGNTNIAELGGSLGAIFGGTAQPYMFANTFSQCTNLTTIPETLFSGVSGSADRMFNGTFQGCTLLTEIPDGLFSDVTGAAYGMFFSTFAGCTLLTSIPVDLFKNVRGEPGLHAFANLFNGAENITNFVDANGNVVSTYVPTQFFDGLTEPANYSDNMFKDAFAGTKLAQTCPDGIFNVDPYYATAISPKVVCAVLPKITYDFSGGTGENTDGYPVFFVAGETVVPENTSVKSGYKFSYWTCYADGSLCDNPSQNPGDIMDLGLSASELKAVQLIELRANWATCPAGYMCPADSAPIECPANSTSTDGATSCTCNSGFTLTGTAVGAITTTGDACRLVPEFTITTIEDMADKTFSFTISAAGLYTIDWGDGNVQKIGKDTTATTYTHTYESAGVYTIGIAGDATAYNATNAAISFRNNTYVAELGGRLGAIFGGTAQPYMFLSTFQNCTNLTTIPSDLFSGVSGAADRMFNGTFGGCTSLTEIPDGLFSGVDGAANGMFYSTFSGCTNLTTIPSTLFSGVSGSADRMFGHTFYGCTSLTSIPVELFKNVKGEPGTNAFVNLFNGAENITKFVDADDNTVSTYVPTQFFDGMGVADVDMLSNLFQNAFANTQLVKVCPDGTYSLYSLLDVQYVGAAVCQLCPQNGQSISGENLSLSSCFIPTECSDATGQRNGRNYYNTESGLYDTLVCDEYISCNTGYYFDDNTNKCTDCPEGSYCSNGVKYTCPPEANKSDLGAGSIDDCYAECSVDCTETLCIDNATCEYVNATTPGKKYYEQECDAVPDVCEMTIMCKTGYYFDDNTGKCTVCPEGSYCSNGVKYTCPPEANNSESGAVSIDDCYAECSVDCTKTLCIDNATCEYVNATTPGKQYYEQKCNAVPVDCEMTIVCNTGYYFDDNTGKCTVCPAGSYCSNGDKYTCPPEANNSDLGADSIDDCYAECSAHCTQKLCIENAKCEYVDATTPGKQYYEQECDAVPGDCAMTIVCNTGYSFDDNTGKCETAAYWVKYLDEDDNVVRQSGASYGGMYTFSADPISKQGYTQNGWSVVYPESMSGKKYEMGKTVQYNFTEDITLKPEYSANTFELVFQYDNADNAGSVSLPQGIVATYDQPLPEFTQYDEIELRLTEELGNSGWALKVSDGWKLNEKFKAYNKNGTSTNICPLWSEDCDLPYENNTIVNVYPVWTTAYLKCAPGYYGNNKQCAPCRAGNACPGWNTWVSADQEYGMFQCPENSFSKGGNLDYCTCAQGYSVDADYNGSIKLFPTAQDGFKNVSCQKKQVPMYYDLNGGYGNIETDYWEYGTVATPVTARMFNADEKAYRPGYTFGGWGEKPSAQTPVSEYANYTEPKTLYAIWMPCGHGTYMTAAQAQDLQTECTACPPEYPSTLDTASENIEQCYADCEAQKDVEGGVAFRDQEYVLYGNQCTYSRGQDENGNGCDIINDVCWATDCKPEFEMIDGKCVACARDFALDYSRNGNCQVERCVWGFHPNGDKCEQDEIDCDAPNAVSAKRIWDSSLKSYGACVITQCVPEMHVEANTCVSNVRTCALENGFGEQVWNDKRNVWKDCVATHCNPGYTNDARLTNENWKQCGRCNNMFGLDGKLAVSSYVSECEIATCMYQGEKYVLENNECRLICDDYRDETGRRYWDEERAECVHDCGNGYLPW